LVYSACMICALRFFPTRRSSDLWLIPVSSALTTALVWLSVYSFYFSRLKQALSCTCCLSSLVSVARLQHCSFIYLAMTNKQGSIRRSSFLLGLAFHLRYLVS